MGRVVEGTRRWVRGKAALGSGVRYMNGWLFAHTVFISSVSLMRFVVLLGRRRPVLFPFAKLSTNEDGRLTNGDASTKMTKLETKSE